MLSKDEILEKLETSTTWRQSGVTMEEVKAALTAETENSSKREEIAELREKITNLTETNRKLKAEIKALKGR